MIPRRVFLALAASLGLLAPLGRSYAESIKVHRVGGLYLTPQPEVYLRLWLAAMRELGYVEGQNFAFERRHGQPGELTSLAQELVRLNVDALACGSSAALRAAMASSRTIPIVAVDLESDPVASGYAATLARPGGNMTGFFLDLPEFNAKRLEILKETLPTLARATVLWDPSLERTPLSGMESAARSLQLRLFIREVQDESSLGAVFRDAVENKAGAVVVMQSPRLDAYRSQILQFAAQHRLPVMALFANFTADGGLVSFGPNVVELTTRSAAYFDRVLRGAKPGELPIQRPEKFDFAVSVRTAKTLGLQIPRSVLARADQVFQ